MHSSAIFEEGDGLRHSKHLQNVSSLAKKEKEEVSPGRKKDEDTKSETSASSKKMKGNGVDVCVVCMSGGVLLPRNFLFWVIILGFLSLSSQRDILSLKGIQEFLSLRVLAGYF